MSDSYTIHLLNRHIDGTIFEEECQTLKALLEPCILNLTADELQRKIYSKLVLHCCCTPFKPAPRCAPIRACNTPFKTLFLLPKDKKTYEIKLELCKPEQPQTNNMHFTLTNFNGYKSDANKGFTQPRFEKVGIVAPM